MLLVDSEGRIRRSNAAAFEALGVVSERLDETFRPAPVLGPRPATCQVEAISVGRAFRLHLQPLGEVWLVAPVEDTSIRTLGAFLETIPDATIVVDAEGTIHQTNRQATEMFGYAQETLLGLEVEALLPETLRQAHRAHRQGYQAAPATRGMGSGMELEGRRADGSTFPVEISLSPYTTANRQFVVAAVRDISERRKFEGIKARADRLADEYDALQRSRTLEARLMQSQRLESLGMLAGGVAHDFNNLLVGVLGNASLAALEVPENSSVRQYLAQIEAAAVRASELTNQMLAYAGKSPFNKQPVSLSRVVKEMFELLRSSVATEATLQTNLSDDLPEIEADLGQLRQAILNLVTNAVESQRSKGGLITISGGRMEVSKEYIEATVVPETEPGWFVYLEVADTGCGMTPDVLKQVFDPFFTTKFAGRGLGMSAVLGIMRAHGGTLRIYSEPDRGTAVKLLFPISKELAESTPPATAVFKGGTVLVCDDDPVVRQTSVSLLNALGLTAVPASGGFEAIDILRSSPHIDLLVLDLTMPGLSGVETFRKLRELKIDVPVVVSSGYSADSLPPEMASRRIGGYLQKPYRLAELVEVLQPFFGASDPILSQAQNSANSSEESE